jgi:hypothetical protein
VVFFRLWFIYLSKVAIVGFAFVAIGFAFSGALPRVLQSIGLAIVVPLGIVGALLAIVLMFRKTLACPACGAQSEFVTDKKLVGVNCIHCGLVVVDPMRWTVFGVT